MDNSGSTVQKTLTGIFTLGATVAVGFLSFAGMFVFTSSLLWCGAAFLLAAAVEGQVNAEVISSAFKRMFGKKYLAKGIVAQYLEDQQDDENTFLKDYHGQKRYLEALEKLDDPTPLQLKKLANAENQLHKMQNFFLKQLENYDQHRNFTTAEQAARRLLAKDKEKLLAEIQRKSWLIRFSWLFAIGGGVSSGLAAFSAIKAGIAAFTLLSIVPGGILVGLAACAAVGYTLLLYQTISKMVQEYSGKWRNYFEMRADESSLSHALRCIATVVAVGIAIVATVATAGTWWYAAKQGASLLSMPDKAASILRTVSVSLMALPAFIFSTTNSIESISDISKSSYKTFLVNGYQRVKETYTAEHALQFINPFRLVEKVFSYTANSILFLGHVISMGIISDRFDALPAPVSAFANATGEALTDLNLLPKKEHNHDSLLLKVLFSPLIVTVNILKLLAVVWDRPFTGSFKQSWKNIFAVEEVKQVEPVKYNLSADWRRQQVVEVCDATVDRLKGKDIEKVKTARVIKTLMSEEGSLQEKQVLLREQAAPLAKNRFSFWEKKTTKSQCQMDAALDNLVDVDIVAPMLK